MPSSCYGMLSILVHRLFTVQLWTSCIPSLCRLPAKCDFSC